MSLLPHEKEIFEREATVSKLKDQNKGQSIWTSEEISRLDRKLEKFKQEVYSNLKPWQRVAISRHPSRPHSLDYIKNISEEFVEISGDRSFRDDHAIVAGFAKIDGKRFVVIGQEKGKDTESRIKRNFGMPHPEGYRKALRAMKLAEKFRLPVICLLDTPGAYPGLTAEERGQGWAIAKNLQEMSRVSTPILIVLIGEGCSGGALGMGVGDVIGMLEHAYYSVISPEGCASILWKDSSKNHLAAQALKMQAEDLLKLGIIDSIIPEPMGGAHHDPTVVYQNVKSFILEQYDDLKNIPLDILVERRYQKFRTIGAYN